MKFHGGHEEELQNEMVAAPNNQNYQPLLVVEELEEQYEDLEVRTIHHPFQYLNVS